jgi:hypothetical protein
MSTDHCHSRVVAATREQVGKIIHAQYTTVMHKPLSELAAELGEVLPEGVVSVFYADHPSVTVRPCLPAQTIHPQDWSDTFTPLMFRGCFEYPPNFRSGWWD